MVNAKLKAFRIAKQRAFDAQRALAAIEDDLTDKHEAYRHTENLALLHEQRRILHKMQVALAKAERALSDEDRASLGLDDNAEAQS